MTTDILLVNERAAKAWQDLQETYSLTEEQKKQLWHYYELLAVWNEQINLTAMIEPTSFIFYHVDDSLGVNRIIDFKKAKRIVDVGTGAGFPGIALSICHPTVEFVLIEVTHKKVKFLQEVINQLGLQNVTLCTLDWRTFLRKTNYEADYFCARASLDPEELLRMFKPSSPYKNVPLIYWASQHWQVSELVAPYVTADVVYTVGCKKRRYIVLENSEKNK